MENPISLTASYFHNLAATIWSATQAVIAACQKTFKTLGQWANIFVLPLMYSASDFCRRIWNSNSVAKILQHVASNSYTGVTGSIVQAKNWENLVSGDGFGSVAIGFVKWFIYLTSADVYVANLLCIVLPCLFVAVLWCTVRDYLLHFGEIVG